MDWQRGVSCSHYALRSTPRRTAIINARLQSGFTADNPLAHFQARFPGVACARTSWHIESTGGFVPRKPEAFVFVRYRCKSRIN